MQNFGIDQYVYIMINPAMPGLLKIGKTNRNPTERAEEISGSTGVPTKFHVAFELKVKDSTRAERLIHEKLKDFRVEMNREFFFLPLERAISMISTIVLENDLDAEDIKVQPYKFNYKFFSDSTELFTEVTNSIENWEQAKSHFSKGFITDWLKKRKEYDALINLEKAQKTDSSEAFLLSVIIHSILPENECRFGKIAIDDYSFLDHFLFNKKKYQEALLYGEIYNFYKGYLFSKKKEDNKILKTLDYIKDNGETDSFEKKLEKIKKLRLWHTTQEYPYRRSIYYDQLEFLISEGEFVKLSQDYIIPHVIKNMFYTQENYFEACKLLKPNNLKFEEEFISRKEIEDFKENYFLYDDWPENIIYREFEDYKQEVEQIKMIRKKYPPKNIIYEEYYFNEVFEIELINGEDVPLVKIIDQETMGNYFIPQFLLEGLKSRDLTTFKFVNKVWITLQGKMSKDKSLIEDMWWIFIQAIDIDSLGTPGENEFKLFHEKVQEGRCFFYLNYYIDLNSHFDHKKFFRKIKEERLYFNDSYSLDLNDFSSYVFKELSAIKVLLGESQNSNKNFEILFESLIYIILKLEINDGGENYLIKNSSIKNIRSNYSNRGIHFSVEVMNQIKSFELPHLLFQNCIMKLKLMEQLGANYILPFEIYTDLFSNPDGKFFRGLKNLFSLSGSGLEKKSFLAAILFQYLRLKIPELSANSRAKPNLTNYIINNIRLLSQILG